MAYLGQECWKCASSICCDGCRDVEEEMDSELDRTLNVWDEKSCAEFEQFLDDWHAEQEPAPIPCTCYYTDVDVVENRYCEAHGRF